MLLLVLLLVAIVDGHEDSNALGKAKISRHAVSRAHMSVFEMLGLSEPINSSLPEGKPVAVKTKTGFVVSKAPETEYENANVDVTTVVDSTRPGKIVTTTISRTKKLSPKAKAERARAKAQALMKARIGFVLF